MYIYMFSNTNCKIIELTMLAARQRERERMLAIMLFKGVNLTEKHWQVRKYSGVVVAKERGMDANSLRRPE